MEAIPESPLLSRGLQTLQKRPGVAKSPRAPTSPSPRASPSQPMQPLAQASPTQAVKLALKQPVLGPLTPPPLAQLPPTPTAEHSVAAPPIVPNKLLPSLWWPLRQLMPASMPTAPRSFSSKPTLQIPSPPLPQKLSMSSASEPSPPVSATPATTTTALSAAAAAASTASSYATPAGKGEASPPPPAALSESKQRPSPSLVPALPPPPASPARSPLRLPVLSARSPPAGRPPKPQMSAARPPPRGRAVLLLALPALLALIDRRQLGPSPCSASGADAQLHYRVNYRLREESPPGTFVGAAGSDSGLSRVSSGLDYRIISAGPGERRGRPDGDAGEGGGGTLFRADARTGDIYTGAARLDRELVCGRDAGRRRLGRDVGPGVPGLSADRLSEREDRGEPRRSSGGGAEGAGSPAGSRARRDVGDGIRELGCPTGERHSFRAEGAVDKRSVRDARERTDVAGDRSEGAARDSEWGDFNDNVKQHNTVGRNKGRRSGYDVLGSDGFNNRRTGDERARCHGDADGAGQQVLNKAHPGPFVNNLNRHRLGRDDNRQAGGRASHSGDNVAHWPAWRDGGGGNRRARNVTRGYDNRAPINRAGRSAHGKVRVGRQLAAYGHDDYDDAGDGTSDKDDDDDSSCFFDLQIVATPEQPDPFFALLEARIFIIDVNDNSPTFYDEDSSSTLLRDAIFSLAVPENSPAGLSLALPRAWDPDAGSNGAVSYSLDFDDGDGGGVGGGSSGGATNDDELAPAKVFELRVGQEDGGGGGGGMTSGPPYLVVRTPPDRERRDRYSLWLHARDGGTPPHEAATRVHVRVTDENDNAPRFTQSQMTVEIPENSPVGTPVVRVQASDPDEGENGKVQYRLASWSSSSSSSQPIPPMSSSLLSLASSSSLTPSSSSSSSPPSSAKPRRRPDTALFWLDSSSGLVVVWGLLDREEADVHRLVIVATDCAPSRPASATATLTIVVGDENDTPPEIELRIIARTEGDAVTADDTDDDDGGGDGEVRGTASAATVVVSEASPPGFPIALISVSDRDSGSGGVVSLSISLDGDEESAGKDEEDEAGAAADLPFRVRRLPPSPDRYLLETGVGLDRERRERHVVRVVAKDSGVPRLSSTAVVFVRVADANDNPPTFPRRVYEAAVAENGPPGLRVASVMATDADVGKNGAVVYSIERVTALRISAGGADAAGGGDAAASWAADVAGTARPPAVVRPSSSAFRIELTTGLVTASQSLDREDAPGGYALAVVASDRGVPPLSATATVIVRILDRNDNAPQFELPDFHFYVRENQPAGNIIGRVSAWDPDEGDNGKLEYAITVVNGEEFDKNDAKHRAEVWDQDPNRHAADDGESTSLSSLSSSSSQQPLFSIDPDTGVIRAGFSFDREKQHFYTLEVRARDLDQTPTSRLSSSARVFIHVVDEDDNAPEFLAPKTNSTFVFVETTGGAVPGTTVYPVSAIDPDSLPPVPRRDDVAAAVVAAADETKSASSSSATSTAKSPMAPMQYSIDGGNPRGLFAIDARTGLVTVREALTDEHAGLHRLVLCARDTRHRAIALLHVFANATLDDVTAVNRLITRSLATPLSKNVSGLGGPSGFDEDGDDDGKQSRLLLVAAALALAAVLAVVALLALLVALAHHWCRCCYICRCCCRYKKEHRGKRKFCGGGGGVGGGGGLAQAAVDWPISNDDKSAGHAGRRDKGERGITVACTILGHEGARDKQASLAGVGRSTRGCIGRKAKRKERRREEGGSMAVAFSIAMEARGRHGGAVDSPGGWAGPNGHSVYGVTAQGGGDVDPRAPSRSSSPPSPPPSSSPSATSSSPSLQFPAVPSGPSPVIHSPRAALEFPGVVQELPAANTFVSARAAARGPGQAGPSPPCSLEPGGSVAECGGSKSVCRNAACDCFEVRDVGDSDRSLRRHHHQQRQPQQQQQRRHEERMPHHRLEDHFGCQAAVVPAGAARELSDFATKSSGDDLLGAESLGDGGKVTVMMMMVRDGERNLAEDCTGHVHEKAAGERRSPPPRAQDGAGDALEAAAAGAGGGGPRSLQRSTPDGSIGEADTTEHALADGMTMATSRCTSDCRRFGHSDRCWMPNTATSGVLCRGIPSASSPATPLCPLASCPPPAPGRQPPPPHAPRPSGAPRFPPPLPATAAAPGDPARSTEPPAPRAAFPPPAHGERPRAPANLGGAVTAVHGEGAAPAGRGPGPARGPGEAAGSPARAQPDAFLVRKASLGGGGRDEAAAPFPRCDEHYL
ncbi:uncharacterized protein LOC116952389 isoform X2 [Petromyzon marinus]|uniref:uncharacterized protein LOC116952389 isoform X2 n=1 Tax=Petromyzon marinus TaxID=7757 RepID=UPI003F6F11BD